MAKNKGDGGFLEDILHNFKLYKIVRESRDSDGKIRPYKAANIARKRGYDSREDFIHIGALIRKEDTDFDNSELYNYSEDSDDCLWVNDAIEADYELDNEEDDDELYNWREDYSYEDNCGVDPEDYETEEEFIEAIEEERENEYFMYDFDDGDDEW